MEKVVKTIRVKSLTGTENITFKYDDEKHMIYSDFDMYIDNVTGEQLPKILPLLKKAWDCYSKGCINIHFDGTTPSRLIENIKEWEEWFRANAD